MQSESWRGPGRLVAVMLAGWTNRHQQAVIAYRKEEIEAHLRELSGEHMAHYRAERPHPGNALIESLDDTPRAECPSADRFADLLDARTKLGRWQLEYIETSA